MIKKFFFIVFLISMYLWFTTTKDKTLLIARGKAIYEFVLTKGKSLKIDYNYSKPSKTKKNNRW